MRVCFIVNQLAAWGKIGGFGVNTRRLARALVERGLEVHAVLPRRNGPKGTESLDGIIVHGQSDREVFFGKRIYQQIDADIYHSEEPTVCTYWAQRSMPSRVHLVTSMDPRSPEDWLTELRHATWSRRRKFPFQRFYEDGFLVHRAVRSADGVYVEAEFLQEKVQQLYNLPEAPGLLSKPIEAPPGPFKKSRNPLCIFLGRFDKRKRPEVFFQLVERMPDIDFIAVGRAHDPGYQTLLERYFDLRNLKVTGFVDPFHDDKLHQILSEAWILVHPAAREGLPTAFQEASVHEMAIVAHVDPGGYVSRFGRVVPIEAGLDALEGAVRQMIETGEWREKGRAGRRYNLEHHAIDLSIDAHLHVYREHLERKGRNSTVM